MDRQEKINNIKNILTTKSELDLDDNLIWIEKFRPQKLRGIVGQNQSIDILRKFVESNNLPNLLLYGAPGSGKTSAILALAKELFGPRLFKERVLELNASDERGISYVRSKIKTFAKLAVGK